MRTIVSIGRVVGALVACTVVAGCGAASSTDVGTASAPSSTVVASTAAGSPGCADLPVIGAAASGGVAESMRQLVLDDQLDMSTVTPLYGELIAFDDAKHQEDIDVAAEAIDPNEPASLRPLLERNGFVWAAYQHWTGANGDGVSVALVALRDSSAAIAYANEDLQRACEKADHIEPTRVLPGGAGLYERWGRIPVPMVIGVVGNVEVRIGGCTCTPGVDPLAAADSWAAAVTEQFATET